MSAPQLVLASGSPRRREFLERLGIPFAVVPSQAPELPVPAKTPTEHVVRLSREKAREVAERPGIPGRWFLGSDTVVLRDETILGKPEDAADAAGDAALPLGPLPPGALRLRRLRPGEREPALPVR